MDKETATVRVCLIRIAVMGGPDFWTIVDEREWSMCDPEWRAVSYIPMALERE